MARKKPSASAPAPGAITPRDRSGDLPPLALSSAPRTPAEALDAACGYALAHAASGRDSALVSSAYRAILAAYPGLTKAYAVERLAGVDRVGDYLAALAAPVEDPA